MSVDSSTFQYGQFLSCSPWNNSVEFSETEFQSNKFGTSKSKPSAVQDEWCQLTVDRELSVSRISSSSSCISSLPSPSSCVSASKMSDYRCGMEEGMKSDINLVLHGKSDFHNEMRGGSLRDPAMQYGASDYSMRMEGPAGPIVHAFDCIPPNMNANNFLVHAHDAVLRNRDQFRHLSFDMVSPSMIIPGTPIGQRMHEHLNHSSHFLQHTPGQDALTNPTTAYATDSTFVNSPSVRGAGRAQSLHDIWEESLDIQRQRRRSELSSDAATTAAAAVDRWQAASAADGHWRVPPPNVVRSGGAVQQDSVDDFLARDPDRRGSVHAFLSLEGPPDPALLASLLLEDDPEIPAAGPPTPYNCGGGGGGGGGGGDCSSVGPGSQFGEGWLGGGGGGGGEESLDFQVRIARQLAAFMSGPDGGVASGAGSPHGSATNSGAASPLRAVGHGSPPRSADARRARRASMGDFGLSRAGGGGSGSSSTASAAAPEGSRRRSLAMCVARERLESAAAAAAAAAGRRRSGDGLTEAERRDRRRAQNREAQRRFRERRGPARTASSGSGGSGGGTGGGGGDSGIDSPGPMPEAEEAAEAEAAADVGAGVEDEEFMSLLLA